MTHDTHSPRACEGERCGLRPCRGAAMPDASEEGVLFGFADRSVRVTREAYAIFLERERGLEAQVQALGDEVERLRAGASQDQLWAVHAQGPDEIYAAFSREDAEQHAAALNALPMAGIQVSAAVIASPWSAAEHWKYLAEQERDHAAALKLAATHPAQTEQQPVPDAVWEALQRMIESTELMGPHSREDALLVARYRDRYRLFAAPVAQTEQQPVVPEGYALVPQTMHLDKGVIEALLFHVGGLDGAEHEDKFVDGILWVGEVQGDDGERESYGLNIACAECAEEGSTTLVEFAAPQPEQSGLVEALRMLTDAVSPNVIDWVRCGLSANGRLVDGGHPALRALVAARSAALAAQGVSDGRS